MAHDTHVYGEVNSQTGLKRVFREIRHDIDSARSRPGLTELYKRAGYLITLTHAPSWEEKWGGKATKLRGVAEKEFATTARKINRRARQIGAEADYDEKWGK
jgi:hypothetical protein